MNMKNGITNLICKSRIVLIYVLLQTALYSADPKKLINISPPPESEGAVLVWVVTYPDDLDYVITSDNHFITSPSFSEKIVVTSIVIKSDRSVIQKKHTFINIKPPPPVVTLTVEPKNIEEPKTPVTVKWEATDKVTLNVGDGPETVANVGEKVLLPERTTLVTLTATNEAGDQAFAQELITIRGPTPGPGPGPGPGPKVVLIVYDEETKHQQQLNVINSLELRKYLTNNKINYRIWASNVDPAPAGSDFVAAFGKFPATSKDSWIFVNGYSGTLPSTVEETIELIKKNYK